jgi:uncharacterized protein (TIGR00369 family)
MDTKLGIEAMPAHEEADEVWLEWATAYPTVRALNLVCRELSPHGATFFFDDVPFPPNPNGAVNGGMVALAADQVMGVLAARCAPTGSVPVTAVLNVQFHSPAQPPLTFRAHVLPGGRFIQTVEVLTIDADGRRCATATGTMAVGSATRRTVEKI